MEIGEKINHLTLIKDIGIKGGRHWGLFQCDCGNIKEIRIDHVQTGNNKGCGCLNKKPTYGNYKYGICYTRIYQIWEHMKKRCFCKTDKAYKDYGGRGITICDEWLNPKAFYDWSLENGYSDNLSIDRINVNGNYEPSNCRWADAKQQANNRRSNILITRDGRTQTLSQWCEELNIPYSRTLSRLKMGWKEEELFMKRRRKNV